MIFQLVLTWGSETQYGELLRSLIKMHRDECGVKLLVGGVSSLVDIWKLFSATLDYFICDCTSICVYPIVKPPAEKL